MLMGIRDTSVLTDTGVRAAAVAALVQMSASVWVTRVKQKRKASGCGGSLKLQQAAAKQ
jgi:hypothetical protein